MCTFVSGCVYICFCVFVCTHAYSYCLECVFSALGHIMLSFLTNIFTIHKLNSVTPPSSYLCNHLPGHAYSRRDDLWPLVDCLHLVVKRASVMLSSATVCLFHNSPHGLMLQIDSSRPPPSPSHIVLVLVGSWLEALTSCCFLGRILDSVAAWSLFLFIYD